MKANNKEFDYKTIKTFKDACNKMGIDYTRLPDMSFLPSEFSKPIIACYKLMVIFKAINDGWKADFADDSQKKYWPYFSVEKASGGRSIRFSVSDYFYGITATSIGGRLCTNSKEKAEYIATQFVDLYEDFFLFPDIVMQKIDSFLDNIKK